jgi:hypothetical protein
MTNRPNPIARPDRGVPASRKEWRWIADFPDYMVSSQGDVRHRRVNAPLLAGDTDPKGYRRVSLGGKHRRIARLVCEAFHGRCPPGHECAHLDGNKNNNSADNLSWVTRSENQRHSIAHGTHFRPPAPRGEKQAHAKLTEQQVREMRVKAAAGVSRRALAREYGVSLVQTQRVVTKEDWAHVE